MSKLIDALNRLQTLETNAVLSRQATPMISSKTAETKGNEPLFNLVAEQWLTVLRKEYFQSFAREGGGAVKIAVFPGEKSLQDCEGRLGAMAREEAYVFAKVDARFTKAHMIEKLFHKVAKQLDWDDLAYRYVLRLLEENGYQVPTSRSEFSLRQVAALNERKEPMLKRDLQTWLEKTIEGDSGLCREFRMAMIRLCMAQLDAGDSDRVLANSVKEWLCGDLRLVSGVKKALIYQKVARHNARHMLSSLTRWLRLTGSGGLVFSLDISRYFAKKSEIPSDGSFSFTPSATMDLFELLRQFLDMADELEGLLMVVLAPKEFLTDTRRGVDRYEALKLRVWDDVRPKHSQNPLSTLVRIEEKKFGVTSNSISFEIPQSKEVVPDLEARRVVEGLRSGVPNRHVVTALGCLQPEVEGRFRRMLEATHQNSTAGSCPRGMVIEGDFGSGKSHVLEYLQTLALDANFICSRIVISKETPLYHPVRLFYSAIESAVVPNKRGEVFAEIAGSCDVWTPRYKYLVDWVNNPESGIDSRFAASLLLYERMSSDMELGNRMTRFWNGDPIGVGELKRFLQEAGFGDKYTFAKITAAELARQRFQFAARFMQAAGYAGWILLIDEAELIGRYAITQRAKSYGEITRLMNVDGEQPLPGLGTVVALTNDFREEVLEKKGDRIKLLEKLRAKQTPADDLLAEKAEQGMGLLESQRIPVSTPTQSVIEEAYSTIRNLHLNGHGWRLWEQDSSNPVQIESRNSMRKYVKSWITRLDLLRLFPGQECEIEVSTLRPTYDEPLEPPTPQEASLTPQEYSSPDSPDPRNGEQELTAPALGSHADSSSSSSS